MYQVSQATANTSTNSDNEVSTMNTDLTVRIAELEAEIETLTRRLQVKDDIIAGKLTAKDRVKEQLRDMNVQRFVDWNEIVLSQEEREKLDYISTMLCNQRGIKVTKKPCRYITSSTKGRYFYPNVYPHEIMHEAAIYLGYIPADTEMVPDYMFS